MLTQDPNDLLFREPEHFIVRPLLGAELCPFLEEVQGLRSNGIGSNDDNEPGSLRIGIANFSFNGSRNQVLRTFG